MISAPTLIHSKPLRLLSAHTKPHQDITDLLYAGWAISPRPYRSAPRTELLAYRKHFTHCKSSLATFRSLYGWYVCLLHSEYWAMTSNALQFQVQTAFPYISSSCEQQPPQKLRSVSSRRSPNSRKMTRVLILLPTSTHCHCLFSRRPLTDNIIRSWCLTLLLEQVLEKAPDDKLKETVKVRWITYRMLHLDISQTKGGLQ